MNHLCSIHTETVCCVFSCQSHLLPPRTIASKENIFGSSLIRLDCINLIKYHGTDRGIQYPCQTAALQLANWEQLSFKGLEHLKDTTMFIKTSKNSDHASNTITTWSLSLILFFIVLARKMSEKVIDLEETATHTGESIIISKHHTLKAFVQPGGLCLCLCLFIYQHFSY